jgi:hypothetical protein
MNVLSIVYLLDQNWIDYCKSHFPTAPCDPPPGPDPSFSIITGVCITFAAIVAVSSIFQAISRLRISSPEEFREANKRLAAGMGLIISLRGKALRQHCRRVSRDVIQVTGFARRHVSICFHNSYSSYSRQRSKMAAMMLFIQENKLLRTDGVFIAVLYFIPLLTSPLVKQTKATMNRYSASWLPLFEQYTIENPECQSYF